MTGKTHKQMAITFALGTCSVPAISDMIWNAAPNTDIAVTGLLAFAASAVVGGLLPDIDNEKSTICKYLPFVSKLIQCAKGKKPFRHRMLFHSIYFPILWGLLAYILFANGCFLPTAIFCGICIGNVSHIFADGLLSNVFLFAPFSYKPFSLFHLEGKQAIQLKLDRIFRYVLSVSNIGIAGYIIYRDLHLFLR